MLSVLGENKKIKIVFNKIISEDVVNVTSHWMVSNTMRVRLEQFVQIATRNTLLRSVRGVLNLLTWEILRRDSSSAMITSIISTATTAQTAVKVWRISMFT